MTQGNAFVRTANWKSFQRFQIVDKPVSGEDCDVKVGADDAVYEANLQIAGATIRKSVDDGKGPPAAPNTTGNGSFDYQIAKDPVEQDYESCFGAQQQSAVTRELIGRRREKQTLDALEDLVRYLRGAREERKAVIVITDGSHFDRSPPGVASCGIATNRFWT